jgi:hypothetical protein
MNAKAQEVIHNLLNGNLEDAKEGATYLATITIVQEAETLGNNYNEALLMACYLKGIIPFEDYCEALNNRKPR